MQVLLQHCHVTALERGRRVEICENSSYKTQMTKASRFFFTTGLFFIIWALALWEKLPIQLPNVVQDDLLPVVMPRLSNSIA
jgi:hypothetical protein